MVFVVGLLFLRVEVIYTPIKCAGPDCTLNITIKAPYGLRTEAFSGCCRSVAYEFVFLSVVKSQAVDGSYPYVALFILTAAMGKVRTQDIGLAFIVLYIADFSILYNIDS